MAEAAVLNLLSNFAPYLNEEMNLLTGVRDEIEFIRDEFAHMTNFLRVADAVEERNPELKVWVKEVRKAAYDTADVLDMYMLRLGHHHGDGLRGFLRKVSCFIKTLGARHQIASEVKRIKSSIVNISQRHQRYSEIYGRIEQGSSSNHPGIAWHDCRSDALLLPEANLVAIDKPKSRLIKLLIDEDPRLKVLSIVGMGGLGKTTLTKKVYDDDAVKRHFQNHAWITVSESFKVEELLKDMIRQLFEEVKQPLPGGVDNMDRNSLKMIINDFLLQKRYVLVLDDVWTTPAWEFFKIIFPKCNCGSRIILTTRNVELASFASKEYHGTVYNLEPLSPKDSWDLFCRKAFLGNSCPSYLGNLSRVILEKCDGLPLAIVAIGGLLSTKGDRLDKWERIYHGLGAELEGNDKLMSLNRILSLSYFDLQYYLKLCFLYLSIFPEDCFFDHWRLIRLWVAEGFVEGKEGMQIEEVAEGYIDELINRSLVQVVEMTTDGRFKAYRIHDLWREMVLSKSREQNLVSINSADTADKVRRLAVHHSMGDIQSTDFTRLRSLIVFSKEDPLSMFSKVVSSGNGVRLLTVLDLGGTQLQIFPNEIVKLVHLTHLSLRETKVKTIPKSIGNLKKLETLDLKQTDVTELPDEILKLKHLRHLLLYRYKIDGSFPRQSGFKALEGIGSLKSLQKLCSMELNHGSSSIMLTELRKLTQLGRLNLLRLAKEDGKVLCSSLEKLSSLHSLCVHAKDENEIIDLHSLSSAPLQLRLLELGGRLQNLPHWIPSLHNLTQILLKWSKLRDDGSLQLLQDLPNLVSLHLFSAYQGGELCFKAGGFQKLIELDLFNFEGLRWVRVEAGSMPLLKTLGIAKCNLMTKVPSGIEHLTNLKLVALSDMSDILISSLNRNLEGGDYWKIAHIPEVWISDSKFGFLVGRNLTRGDDDV